MRTASCSVRRMASSSSSGSREPAAPVQLGVAPDGGDRGAQLVGRVGHELAQPSPRTGARSSNDASMRPSMLVEGEAELARLGAGRRPRGPAATGRRRRSRSPSPSSPARAGRRARITHQATSASTARMTTAAEHLDRHEAGRRRRRRRRGAGRPRPPRRRAPARPARGSAGPRPTLSTVKGSPVSRASRTWSASISGSGGVVAAEVRRDDGADGRRRRARRRRAGLGGRSPVAAVSVAVAGRRLAVAGTTVAEPSRRPDRALELGVDLVDTRSASVRAGDQHEHAQRAGPRSSAMPASTRVRRRHAPLLRGAQGVADPADRVDELGLDRGRPCGAGSRCRSRRPRRRRRSRTARRGRGSGPSTAPAPG